MDSDYDDETNKYSLILFRKYGTYIKVKLEPGSIKQDENPNMWRALFGQCLRQEDEQNTLQNKYLHITLNVK